MTAKERETLGDVLRLLGGIADDMAALKADVAGIRQAVLGHRDRLAHLEACIEDDTLVDPAA